MIKGSSIRICFSASELQKSIPKRSISRNQYFSDPFLLHPLFSSFAVVSQLGFKQDMISTILLIAAAAASSVSAHEHHGDPQVYLSAQGPHRERLWYNTLPGDGGTQVCHDTSRDSRCRTAPTSTLIGRLRLLRHLHLRSYSLFPLPSL